MTTNVQIMKTKAEKAFAEHFDAVADSLPSEAGKLADRRSAMARFDELGLPHRRIEAWKYTDLRNALGGVDVPAVGSAPSVTAADVDAALGVLAGLDRIARFSSMAATMPACQGFRRAMASRSARSLRTLISTMCSRTSRSSRSTQRL